MAYVFWGSEAILLVQFLDRGATINSEQYVQTLMKLKQWIWWAWLNRKMNKFLLLHNNARSYTSLCIREAITTMRWNVLNDPPYSLILHHPNSNFFSPQKDAFQGHCFVDELKHGMWKSSGASAKSSRWPAKSVSCKGEKSMLKIKKILWQYNLNSIKDATMIYV